MTNPSYPSDKALQRSAFEQVRIARLAGRLEDIKPPRVNAIIDLTDGTLARAAVDQDLPVLIDEWLDAFEEDSVGLQVMKDGNWVNAGQREVVDEDTVFPVELKLPKSFMAADGVLELRYFLIVDNPPRPEDLPVINLRIDRTPPWDRDTPPAVQSDDKVVTDDYLAANPGGLAIELPVYAGQKPNDKVAVFYLNTLPENPADLPPPTLYVDVPPNRTLTIPVDVIQRVGNGGCYVLYVLFDIGGNESKLSTYKSVTVALGALPTGLSDPQVPQAPLDLEDAQRGVVVQIPAFEHGEHTDTFVVDWGSQSFEYPVIAPVPYHLPVPSEVLKAAYGKATGELDTIVSYRVWRGGLAIPTPPDPAKSTVIKVDFSYVGPERPDPDPTWPDPINIKLGACQVFAEGSSTPNELPKSANGKAATLKLTRYDNAKDGELIRFYWNGEHITEADHIVDTQDDPAIEVTIPWKYINDGGNNKTLPVHYAISATASSNAQQSPVTPVNVQAVIVIAPKPEFEGLSAQGRLVCASLIDPDNPAAAPAFRLQIPDLSTFNLAPGAEIRLTWQPYWDTSGDTPLPRESIKEETVKIDGAHPVTGFIWRIEPYDKHILPIYDGPGGRPRGRGKVFYSFEYQSETVSSEPFETIVNIAGPSGTCEV